MVVVPSSEPEWAVYIASEETGSRVAFKRFSVPLRDQMMIEALGAGDHAGSYSLTDDAQKVALARLDMLPERHVAELHDGVAELLDDVWWRMLGRTRYPAEGEGRADGTLYLVAHWRRGQGFRSGETWSPEQVSRPQRLVSLAEQMAEYAQAPSLQQEEALTARARAMLARLNGIGEPPQN